MSRPDFSVEGGSVSNGKPFVLYIDDEIEQCRLVGDFFTSRGMDIMFAFNGRMAKEILSRATPSLIFLDLHMPKMSGKEFLKYLRLDLKNKALPVFVITGFPKDISNLEQEAFEIQGFFTKPVKLEELLIETKKILNLKK